MGISAAIIMNKEDVADARKKRDRKRHLAKGTSENPQPTDAKCPSNNPHGIWCSCVDLSPINRLDPHEGGNLIVGPATLIPVWLKEIDKHMIKGNPMFPWQPRYAYGTSMNGRKLHKNDLDLLQPKADWDGKGCPWKKGSKFLIVVTSPGSYEGHVNNVFATWDQPKRQRGKPLPPKIRKLPDFGFGRVVVDEAHLENTKNATTITLMRTLNGKVQGSWPPRKWFLTGTPFERGPKQIAYWIETLQDNNNIWTDPEFFNDWDIGNDYLRKLKDCTCQRLLQLDVVHQKLTSVDKPDPKIRSEHLATLANVLGTLWLRRSPETSSFFGYKLVVLPKHHCLTRDCPTGSETQKVYDDLTAKIHIEMKRTLATRKQKWIDSGRVGEPPKVAANMWMRMNRTLRILSTFPALASNSETKDLQWTGEELVVQKWAKRIRNDLGNLAEVDSPYERQIEALTDSRYTPKIAEIKRTIDLRPSEKAVFVTMGPVNAMILYWVR